MSETKIINEDSDITKQEFSASVAALSIEELQAAKTYYVMHQRYEEAAIIKKRQDELIQQKESEREKLIEKLQDQNAKLLQALKELRQQMVDSGKFTIDSVGLLGVNKLIDEIEG